MMQTFSEKQSNDVLSHSGAYDGLYFIYSTDEVGAQGQAAAAQTESKKVKN